MWLIVSIFVGIIAVLIGIATFDLGNKMKKVGIMKKTNYEVFFIIGIAWIPIGIVSMITINIAIGFAFMAMGIGYLAIGLVNRDKWEKKK